MDISIILPTYNEREAVTQVIDRILGVFPDNKQIEIVVVDDCSPDGTAEAVRKKYSNDRRVETILRKNKKPGLGNSILDGILFSSGKTIVGMDADGNHPPETIPKLVNELQAHGDIAVASRFVGKKQFLRIQDVGSYIFNSILRYGLGYPIIDNTSGFYAMRRTVFDSLPYQDIYSDTYGEYHFKLMYAAHKKGYTISEIPVVYQERVGGESKSLLMEMIVKYLAEAYRWKNVSNTKKYEQ
jgi:dolichol-phosphate mannosyltransferase